MPRAKYAVITGFLGKLNDRFAEYQPSRSLEEKFELASQIGGVAGLELVYPTDFDNPERLAELLASYKLGVSAVNLNVKAEERWRFGSFSSPDPKVRRDAIKYLTACMDFAAELGAGRVTTALLNDGSDYFFEIDYLRAWRDTVESIKEAASHRQDVIISIEYKVSEPRVHTLIGNAGTSALFCSQVGMPNVGVTLDVGHALQAGEIPAASAALLATAELPFYIHINDNFRTWDWDMMPGLVNLWDYIEFLFYLKRLGYDGWYTADVFPGRLDPVKVFAQTFQLMDFMFELADRLDEGKMSEIMGTGKATDAVDYLLSVLRA